MADGLQVTIEVDPKSWANLEKATNEQIERATAATVMELAKRLETATLITLYTQNAQPAKPSGSTYMRTFRLQQSSQVKMGSAKLPSIDASWEAKAAYASFVIGPAKEQAAIHSGRWPALELAINNVNAVAPKIFDENMRKFER